jgi:hypothetical protein
MTVTHGWLTDAAHRHGMTPTTDTPTTPADGVIADAVARAVAAVGLAGVGLIHLLDITGKFSETPYMGWMYVGLIIACLGVAGALVRSSARVVWLAAIVLPLSAMIGFTLTRTVGLPQAMDDIGNWGEPLGMASLFVEGSLVALGAGVLTARARGRVHAPATARPVGGVAATH